MEPLYLCRLNLKAHIVLAKLGRNQLINQVNVYVLSNSPSSYSYWSSLQKMQEQKLQRDSKNQTDAYSGLTNIVLSLQYSTKEVKLNRKYIISDLVASLQLTNCLVFNENA